MLSLRRDVGFDIPLLPFSVSRILPAVQILISSMGVQNSPALLPPRSVCPLPICPSCRCRSQPLPGASRKQRYNTLDFPTENRVPTGMLLAPIGNPEPRGYSPLDTLHFRRQYIYKSAQPCIFHNVLTPIGTNFVCMAAGERFPAALPLIRRFSVLCALRLPLPFPLLWGYSRFPHRNNRCRWIGCACRLSFSPRG